MRFREIFRFEVAERMRQRSTWLYLGLLFLLCLLRADATDTDIVHYHAPVHAAASTLMVGVMATLITAALFVEAGQRDLRARMDPLFYTTPLRSSEYLGGRFTGSLAVNALLLLVVPAALPLATLVMTSETLGRFRLEAYLLPYLAFLLPNLLVNAAVLFGVTVFTRRSLPSYLGALALTVTYMYALTAGPGSSSTAWALADPTGAVALGQMTRGWTQAELNTSLIGLDGLLLWNRLLWSVLGTGMLAFTIARFRLMHAGADSHRRPRPHLDSANEAAPPVSRGRPVVPPATRSFGLRTRARQMLDIAAIGIRQLVLSLDFLLVALALFVFSAITTAEAWLFGGTLYWPLTRSVATSLTEQGMPFLIVVLTVFYAGELVWRERDARIETFGDSVPMPDWVPLTGKLLALGFMVVMLHALVMASGIAAQALQGYSAFEPLLYVRILFGMNLADSLLFAVLALAAHVLVNQKYLGHFIAVLLYVATLRARALGIEHNLLVYGSDPGWTWSDLNGFGPFLAPFVWFKLYWAGWALLLGIVALLFWTRGAEGSWRARLRLARQRFTRGVATCTAAAMLLVLAAGGFVFYNTNILNDYRTPSETAAMHAEYERRYKRFEHLPQASRTSIRLHVELYPERREATMRATYRLVNRTAAPIGAVHLSSTPHPELTLRGVTFTIPARPSLEDPVHGYRIYTLGRALQPGESADLHLELAVAPRGFRNREQPSAETAMVGEFTNLGSWLLPEIGYQRASELSSASARRDQGLPPAEVRPSIHDRRARQIPRMSHIQLEAVIGTAAEQIAVVPGALQRSWTDGARRYFHYRTEAPILNFFSVLAAKYAVRQVEWKGIDIRVLHHPAHTVNVDRIIRAAQASLDYSSAQFGPYPHRHLWLVETPQYASGARAYGGQIVYSETSPMAAARTDRRPAYARDDPALTLAAHELAHQWWGQQVIGADVQGSQMLSETLAQYSALMVLERAGGPGAAHRILRNMHGSYIDGRGRHKTLEVPLLLTSDHGYLHYGKGAVVMYALQDAIGEARINTALRRFLRKHAMQGAPYPTTLDLYRELQAVTPAPLQYLLHDLLATITLWDLRTISARAEPAAAGKYRVTLEVEATKLRSDSIGNHVEVAMNDLVDVAVFAAAPDGAPLGKPLYLTRHRLRSGRQTITVTVRGKPVHAGIDPYHKLLVRHSDALYQRAVKVAEVEMKGRAVPGER